MTHVKPIKSEKDHKAALERISELLDEDPGDGTAASDELEVLSVLAERYEALNSKRTLSLSMIRLSAGLGIPAEILIRQPELPNRSRERVSVEKRSISQEVVRILEKYLAKPSEFDRTPTDGFLALIGAWKDDGSSMLPRRVRFSRVNSPSGAGLRYLVQW